MTVVVGLGALAFVARTAWRYGDTAAGTAKGPVEIDVPKGASAHDVADLPVRGGAHRSPGVFRLYAGQRGVAGRFKAGRYVLAAPVSPRQILDALVKGAAASSSP